MKDKTYAANGRSRGLMAVPVGTVPTGTRCIQINIPDSADAERMVAGALYELTHWTNYEREATHKGRLWAQAWRDALLTSVPFGACGMAIEFMQDECGLNYREVGSPTWIPIYDGLHCLQSEGGQHVLRDAFDDFLQQMFDDGVLQQGGGQPGPTTPPDASTCRTYHVVLPANGQWLLPFGLGYGDTIIVRNLSGTWCDGTPQWYCTDGAEFELGGCFAGGKHHETGDPLNPGSNHMSLIMKAGTSWYDMPLATFTQLSGTTPLEVLFQANDGSLNDNTGSISFDVEVCKAEAGHFAHEWDFASGPNGWATNPQDGSGWGATWSGGQWSGTYFSIYRTARLPFGLTQHITGVRLFGNSGSGLLAARTNHLSGTNKWIINPVPASGVNVDMTGSDNMEMSLIGTPIQHLSKIIIEGTGTDPFAT